jgi:hypothetical protein
MSRTNLALLALLASSSVAAAATPQTTSEYIVDGGFEQATSSGLNAPGWTGSSNLPGVSLVAVGNPSYAHSGANFAILGGAPNSDQTLRQTVTLPANLTSATLSFYVGIVTQEILHEDHDDFHLEIWDLPGNVLATPVSLDNTNSSLSNNTAGDYYHVPSVNLSPYSGQTIQIVFHATNNGSDPTSFFIDDASLQVAATGGGTGCVADLNTLCLNGARFAVSVQWTDFQGNTGPGNVVPNGSPDSGLMWFFGPDNWEMLVKVLNGCPVNNHYWVFAALTTNVQYTIQVTDTSTGEVKTYTNPLGNPSPAITDTAAFASCS